MNREDLLLPTEVPAGAEQSPPALPASDPEPCALSAGPAGEEEAEAPAESVFADTEPDPAAEEPDPGPSGEPARSAVRPGLAWLRIAIPWALAGTASLVFLSCAAFAVIGLRPDLRRTERFLLGSLFGGRESIVRIGEAVPQGPAGETETADPEAPGTAAETETGPIETAARLKEPEDAADPAEPEPLSPGPTEEEASPGEEGPAEEDASAFRLTNETGYAPDLAECASRRAVPPLAVLRERYGEDAPVVLILHTHGTEAYAECAEGGYRSTDPSLSVLSVGRLLADRLCEAGIPTVRLDTLFDARDFNMAYYAAAAAIRETLERYPSISYIFDLHRDSIELGDGTVYAACASVGSASSDGSGGNGGRAAQMMFVVGTDEAGAEHPDWRDNLGLAVRLQTALSREYPYLMRDINLRAASFNEQYSSGSLLIEIGSSGCALGEAKEAAELLARALVREITGED